jgi:hypothetical protein
MTDNMYSALVTSQLKPGAVPIETPTSRKNKKRLERQRTKKQHELEIARAEVRTNAFTALSDKELLGNKLRKTRICRSVLNNTPCRHGDSCRFAHTEAELLVSECLFGDQCRFVTMKDGVLVNHGLRICKHRSHSSWISTPLGVESSAIGIEILVFPPVLGIQGDSEELYNQQLVLSFKILVVDK